MFSPAATSDRYDALSDEQLMLAYVGDDTAAFDVLYARHESALFRFVRRLLGARFAAEVDEVFQQVWSRVIAERQSFSPEAATWRVWAFTMTYGLAIDRLRMTGREEISYYAHDEDGDGIEAAQIFSRGLLRGHQLAGDDAEHSVAEDLELVFWRAAGRRLIACLDELPADQRAAFLLYHEEGFSIEVLAKTTDADVETVQVRLCAGVERLRECMERYLSVLEHGAAGIVAAAADSEDLHDVRLWRALEHAPDQNTAPDWRRRQSFLKSAHDEVGVLDPDEASADLERAARSWWQRLGPQEPGGSANRRWGVIAVVLAAAAAAVIWRHESTPGPREDGEARQVAVSTPSPAPEVRPKAEMAPTPAPRASAPVAAETPRPSDPRPAKDSQAPTSQALPSTRDKATTAEKPAPSFPQIPEAVERSPSENLPAIRGHKEEPPRPPRAVDTARQSEAANTAPAAAIPPAAPAPTDTPVPPTFDALSQWNRLTITQRGGGTRTVSRADARELGALLGSAALSAEGPQPLKGSPEWRVTLQRNSEVLAVFEVSQSQVRWREGRSPAATGAPSAPALSALRGALGEAVAQPEPEATPPQAAPDTP